MKNNALTIWTTLVLTSMVIVAVGTKNPSKPNQELKKHAGKLTVDQAIEFYQDSTGNALKTPVRTADGSIDFFTSRPNVLAVCATFKSGEKMIVINMDEWAVASDNKRLYILFHEVGHCDFDLEHVDNPKHLMHATVDIPQLSHFAEHFDSVVEMFQPKDI